MKTHSNQRIYIYIYIRGECYAKSRELVVLLLGTFSPSNVYKHHEYDMQHHDRCDCAVKITVHVAQFERWNETSIFIAVIFIRMEIRHRDYTLEKLY